MAVNLLLSYAFHADTRLDAVRRDLVCGRLMIDSGAFTAYTKGRRITVAEYAAYLHRWRRCWDHAITLDVIGDPAASRANTRTLHEQGLPVMPVFTRTGTLAEFDAMVADCGYVAVGGLVGVQTSVQLKRVTMLQRRAQNAGGGIHALGVGSLRTLRASRPYSADASSVSSAFRFGSVVYFDGRDIRNVPLADRARLNQDRDHIRNHGIDLALLVSTGRMPSRENGARQKLMRAMALAYAAADEHLKAMGTVPAPRTTAGEGTHLYHAVIGHERGGSAGDELHQISALDRQLHPDGTHLYSSVPDYRDAHWGAAVDRELHDGPHLYNSVTPQFGLDPSSGLDRHLHTAADVPMVWRIHGRTHQCRAKEATTNDS